MIALTEYRDIFGKPNEGVHAYRFFDIAIIDFILTVISAFILAIVFFDKKDIIKYFFIICLILFSLGIMFHRIFGVNTTINKNIFGVIE
jgi:hypothetical protein